MEGLVRQESEFQAPAGVQGKQLCFAGWLCVFYERMLLY
jgi:hypothetical protein